MIHHKCDYFKEVRDEVTNFARHRFRKSVPLPGLMEKHIRIEDVGQLILIFLFEKYGYSTREAIILSKDMGPHIFSNFIKPFPYPNLLFLRMIHQFHKDFL